MSVYLPPQDLLTIFNVSEYNYSSNGLTISTGDMRYLKLTGGICSGLVTFSSGISTNTIYNGLYTFNMPSANGTFALSNQTVNLIGNQTIAGIKTFTDSPSFNSISNTGLITLPSTTGTLLNSISSFPTQSNYGLCLSDNQTINSLNLDGTCIDVGSANILDNFENGNIANLSVVHLAGKTINCTNVCNYLNSSTLHISAAPTAGSNCTLGNNSALAIDSGNVNLTNSRILMNTLGTVALPSIALNGSNTGIVATASSTLSLVVSGSAKLTCTTTSNTCTQQLRLVSGSAASPSLSFTTDLANNSGFYYISNDNFGISINGSLMVTYNSSGISCNNFLQTSTGFQYSTENPVAYKLFSGTLSGAGVGLFAHGISQLNQKCLTVSAWYRGASAEAEIMTIDFVDGTNIQISGGLASVSYRVVVTYSTVTLGW